ncbi:hypothetical protein ACTQ5K_08760 [Niallia sp. Sow4_A1]|uniref:hypothetical protein n=1 Tax=unclassified Niallia TaxID=2837522 RepID=UPI00203A94BE|nr:hypothetical protein [Niallia sp. MER TA 168]MCM3364223.1 hypothetical protein [Niallia sp. MER TA 168]
MHNNTKENSPLSINWNQVKNSLQVALKYEELDFLSSKDHSGLLISTLNFKVNNKGFIKLAEDLYIKFSFGYVPDRLVIKELPHNVLKIGFSPKNKLVSWTVFLDLPFTKILSGDIFIESTSTFISKELEGMYYSIIVTSRNPLSSSSQDRNIIHKIIEKAKKNDFIAADKFKYFHSPNIDGLRNKNEYFAGTGSNITRKSY